MTESERAELDYWKARAKHRAVPVRRLERGLTARRRQVAKLASQRLSYSEIAARLGIARGTVKAHMLWLFRWFDLREGRQNRIALIRKWRTVTSE